MEKMIGVIESAEFGFGGYQEAMLGLSLSFTFKGSGVGTFVSGGWAGEDTRKDGKQTRSQIGMCEKIISILQEAKVRNVSALKGKPVECTFENMTLVDWRILSEAIL